jgi:hypothetical protein
MDGIAEAMVLRKWCRNALTLEVRRKRTRHSHPRLP